MIKRVFVKDLLRDELVGETVSVCGWVYRYRSLKDKIFIVLRDSTDILQCVVKKEGVSDSVWNDASKLNIEGSVEIEGVLRKDERAPTGYEVEVKRVKVYDYGKPFPILGREEPLTIQKYRHLWIRNRRFGAVLKIKHSLLHHLRDWHINDGWYEVHPAILVGYACEETTTLFEVGYFDQKAYLSQSAQMYLEVLIYALEKVFSITPSFRAERSRTRRHLHEYWHFEIEAAWYDLDDIMKVTEESLKYAIDKTLEEREREFKLIGRDIGVLRRVVDEPWIKMKYEEAIGILQSKGANIEYGQDLGADEERILTLQFDLPIFLTHYPRKIRAFYMCDLNEEVVKNFDLLAPEGFGEIVGGSEREWRYDVLRSKIEEWGLDKLKVKVAGEEVSAYEWYLDLRRYGSVPHSGHGLGLERLTMWVCKLDHIRDAIPFPRLREGWLYP